MATSPQELNSRIAGYLSQEETLDDFHAWFTGVVVDLGRGESEAHKLADAVDGLFIRLSEQELTEPEFDEGLRRLLLPFAQVTLTATVIEARGGATYHPDFTWQTDATQESLEVPA